LVVIQGYEIQNLPNDPYAESTFVRDNIAAGVTQTIVYPDNYKGVAISVQVRNNDTALPCTVNINGQGAFQLGSNATFGAADMNIVTVQITAGATVGTSCEVLAQVTPLYLTTPRQRFTNVRG
jgi:hypothetical protein|tara:strand:- start:2798 stop:3166 length:369 start_codon:yes stop_codon:yes gene_type:complete